jgi:hypothetical protein
MTDLFPISIEQKIACLEREIKLREDFYPRWVAARRMTQETAERELAVMREILQDYAKQQAQRRGRS